MTTTHNIAKGLGKSVPLLFATYDGINAIGSAMKKWDRFN